MIPRRRPYFRLLPADLTADVPAPPSPSCSPFIEADESDPEKAALLQVAARGPNSCWTCGVDRPLRSKHCQVG